MRRSTVVWACALLVCGGAARSDVVETGFTYQGRLQDGGSAAEGAYDLLFELYDDADPDVGRLVAHALMADDVHIFGGYFTAELDFGEDAFTGEARWLQVSVRPYDSTALEDFVPMLPRQPITAAPYALYALSGNEGPMGPVGPQGFEGPVGPKGDKGDTGAMGPQGIPGATGAQGAQGIQGLPGPQGTKGDKGDTGATGPQGEQGLPGIAPWKLSGSSVYYTDGQVGIGTSLPTEALDAASGNIRVRGIGGFDELGASAYVYLGDTNHYIKSTYGFGLNLGTWNVPDVLTIREGTGNVGIGTTDPQAQLEVNGPVRVMVVEGLSGWPLQFRVDGLRALRLENTGAGVGIGDWQDVSAPNVIGGAPFNSVSPGAVGASIGGGGGTALSASSGQTYQPNVVETSYGVIGGGYANTVSGYGAAVSGGGGNTAGGNFASVSGGHLNSASGNHATVSGGEQNEAAGDYSFAGGRQAKANHPGSFVWADSTPVEFTSKNHDQFSVRALGGVRFITGGNGVHVDGNITKSYTSYSSNIVTPVAFGVIELTGAVASGTPNVTCVWNAEEQWYEITIGGVDYFWRDYVTMVTPMGSAVLAATSSTLGKLIVTFSNSSGTAVQSHFQFITYRSAWSPIEDL